MAKKCEVNFNVLPGETILYCPYYANHFFRETRAHYHLANCRRQYELEKKKTGQPMDIFVCPLVYKHHIVAKDWEEHKIKCFAIANREINEVMEVCSNVPKTSGASNTFIVPGTNEVIQMNSDQSQTSAGQHKEWKEVKNNVRYRRGTLIPNLMGIETGPEKRTPSPPQPVHNSYLDCLQKVRDSMQPIGLTKSEKKKWQAERLEMVKREIKEDKARALYDAAKTDEERDKLRQSGLL